MIYQKSDCRVMLSCCSLSYAVMSTTVVAFEQLEYEYPYLASVVLIRILQHWEKPPCSLIAGKVVSASDCVTALPGGTTFLHILA